MAVADGQRPIYKILLSGWPGSGSFVRSRASDWPPTCQTLEGLAVYILSTAAAHIQHTEIRTTRGRSGLVRGAWSVVSGGPHVTFRPRKAGRAGASRPGGGLTRCGLARRGGCLPSPRAPLRRGQGISHPPPCTHRAAAHAMPTPPRARPRHRARSCASHEPARRRRLAWRAHRAQRADWPPESGGVFRAFAPVPAAAASTEGLCRRRRRRGARRGACFEAAEGAMCPRRARPRRRGCGGRRERSRRSDEKLPRKKRLQA